MEDILSLLIPVVFVATLIVERLFPARELPHVKAWVLRGFLFFVLTGAINGVVPAVLAPYMGALGVVSIEKLGTLLGVALTLVLSELFAYWVHRTLHRVHWLWRWTHQMHHSAERVDAAGAALFHPFDITIQVAPITLAAALLGASPDVAAITGFASFLMAMYQHMNVRTPHWTGYLVQRPEGHSVHHQRGLHAYNYGNLALWDLVFGTFKNPRTFAAEAGFWDGASNRVVAMLLGRDVADPPRSSAPPLGAAPTPAE